ncbi:conjugal transfer protein TrbL [Eggerthella sp.]|uniref:conjugal transfer protein TrbL n=1 Tax=Eggerthellaceae TaxID=1643826 RepID=UPI002847E636|nr:conjugal transfer protein TrbL [Eggerthella sp.]MDR3847673.1 conjugal transfer protein TrbL [Eggerthella sp.]
MARPFSIPIRGERGRRFACSFAATLAFCILFFTPGIAWADIADTVNSWLAGVLRDFCNWIFGSQIEVLSTIGADGVLSSSFETMLGSSGGVGMYDVVRGAWEVAVLPIGCGILSFVFTVQLIKISQRMDGTASMPAVKEVVFLLVFFAVFVFLLQHSFEIMQALYEVTRLAIQRVTDMFGDGGAISVADAPVVAETDDVAALIGMAVIAIVNWVVVVVAYVVALVVSWARAIQLYLMAAFSPIPLALMGLEDTRQIGIGYLRSFAGVCIAGIIILIVLISFPIVLAGLNAVNAGTGTVLDGIVGGLSYALQYLAICVLLILSLVKSGAWARDVMGG